MNPMSKLYIPSTIKIYSRTILWPSQNIWTLPSKWNLYSKHKFWPKMIVKSCLKKIFLEFFNAEDYFSLLHKSVQNHKVSNKNSHLSAWRDFKIIFSRPLFTIIFRPKIVFLDTDSILRVTSLKIGRDCEHMIFFFF